MVLGQHIGRLVAMTGLDRLGGSIATLGRRLFGRQSASMPADPLHHPGWGVSIEAIYQIYRQAELGDPAAMYDLFDDIVDRDLTLAGLVEARSDAITGCAVSIAPGAKDRDSVKAADEFREVWNELDHDGLIEHQQHGTNFNGFAASEMDWDYRRAERRFDPVRFHHPRARFFRIATAQNPIVPGAMPDELLVRTGRYSHEVERLIPGKWIVTRRRGNLKLVARSGLMFPCTPYSLMKSHASADWFVFLKRYGIPFVEAKISAWTDDEAVFVAQQGLASMGSDRGLISAESDKVTFNIHDGAATARAANSDVHQRFVVDRNQEMTKVWNGAILSSETGTGSASYALAKEHGGVRYSLLKRDKERLSKSLRMQLAVPWMIFNRRPGVAPLIVIHLNRVEDPTLAPKIALDMKQADAPVDPQQLYELTGFRAPSETVEPTRRLAA